MMRRPVTALARLSLLLSLTVLLSACVRQDAAFYSLDGDNRNSLSILRESYMWSKTWTVKLVTSNGTQCVRRHQLDDVPLAGFQITLYQPEAGVFILSQGDNWYVTTMQECRFQKFTDAPPEPGEIIGGFVERKKELTFLTAEEAARAAYESGADDD